MLIIETKKFKLVRPYQVLKYIREHALIDFLLEIPAKVETSFPDTDYSLKVYIDPEIRDHTCLDVFIKSRYDARGTIDRLDQFNDNYGFDISERANHKISFNLKFS